jgi:predicted RNA binding protein YcfA (HicA-like mRNA interferase family)
MLPAAVPYPSISTLELVKLAEERGWVVKDGAGKGSHIRMVCQNGPPLTIPANRRDLSPGVVRTALNAFGGYKLNDLARLLHDAGSK